jgi:YVTN family beta-propeller protein
MSEAEECWTFGYLTYFAESNGGGPDEAGGGPSSSDDDPCANIRDCLGGMDGPGTDPGSGQGKDPYETGDPCADNGDCPDRRVEPGEPLPSGQSPSGGTSDPCALYRSVADKLLERLKLIPEGSKEWEEIRELLVAALQGWVTSEEPGTTHIIARADPAGGDPAGSGDDAPFTEARSAGAAGRRGAADARPAARSTRRSARHHARARSAGNTRGWAPGQMQVTTIVRPAASGEPRRARRGGAVALLALAAALFVPSAPSARAEMVYVVNSTSASVSVIDSTTNREVPGSPIPLVPGAVSPHPSVIALSPDGKTAYVVNTAMNTVSVIDTQAMREAPGSPISLAVGTLIPDPTAIAITPDGKTVYVVNTEANTVSVIDTQAMREAPGSPLNVAKRPRSIAITPDGKTAYVTNEEGRSISAIDTQTNLERPYLSLGPQPTAIAITPGGESAYITLQGLGLVEKVDLVAKAELRGTRLAVGNSPYQIVLSPDGKTAYVVNVGQDVAVLDTASNSLLPALPTQVGALPASIAITPDGKTAYVSNAGVGTVSAIDTATNTEAPGSPVHVGEGPLGIAIGPNLPSGSSPVAAFSAPRARPKVPVAFDASASHDPDGPISTYAWDFGDHLSASTSGPGASHTYAAPGTYQVGLRLTDGQGALASTTRSIAVAYPGVRVKCPKRARPRGCKYKLQVIAKRPKKGKKPKAQSAVAKAKLKAGRAKVVSLVPKAAFNLKLAAAAKVLVKERVTVKGSTRTRYAKRKIVQ